MSIEQGFALWLTGIPASGKSSITRELVKKLEIQGVAVVVLESDEMRKILTPEPHIVRRSAMTFTGLWR